MVAGMDRDALRIAVIAVIAVALGKLVLPKLPVIGPVVGPYVG